MNLTKLCRLKGPVTAVKLNPAGGNRLFIFIVCVKSVPLHYVKLAYVVLHMAVKLDELFETHILAWKSLTLFRLGWGLCPFLFLLYLWLNYQQTWHDSTLR